MAVKEMKICLLGDAGVGKSSLAYRFVCDRFNPEAESTIGASFMSKTVMVDDDMFKFQIWDTAGQEKYRGLAPMYYRGAAAAVVTYDITNTKSFTMLKGWVRELKQLGPASIVIAIVGNKIDMTEAREISFEDGEEYANEVGALFLEISALSGENVEDLFVKLSRKLPASSPLATEKNSNSVMVSPSQDSGNTSGKKKGCC